MILGLDERKGRWLVKQGFHGKFLGQYYMVFCLVLWSP